MLVLELITVEFDFISFIKQSSEGKYQLPYHLSIRIVRANRDENRNF